MSTKKNIIRVICALPSVALLSLAIALSTSTSSAVSGESESVSTEAGATAIFAGG